MTAPTVRVALHRQPDGPCKPQLQLRYGQIDQQSLHVTSSYLQVVTSKTCCCSADVSLSMPVLLSLPGCEWPSPAQAISNMLVRTAFQAASGA